MSVEVSVERLDPLENQALQCDGYLAPSQYESVMQGPKGTHGSEYAKLMDKLPSSYIKKSHFTSVFSRKQHPCTNPQRTHASSSVEC
jgi:hypothetical protein